MARMEHPDTMGTANRTIPSGMNLWRARCGESRSPGSEGGPEKRTSREADTALRSDPYSDRPNPMVRATTHSDCHGLRRRSHSSPVLLVAAIPPAVAGGSRLDMSIA
jgi:hypothetical protein